MLPTITSQIAGWCAAQDFEDVNAQLCVVSIGFDVEGIASHLIRRTLVGMPSPNACVSCVVLPGGIRNGTLSRVASAIVVSLQDTEGERMHVHVAEEGTPTRTRCTYYKIGGVVVLNSRTLCADLLHRRLSRELIGIAVVLLPHGHLQLTESVVPNIAFCAEILLRGGGAALLPSRRRHPPFVLLSDDPCFVRHLVQRRYLGHDPFLLRVHIDDVQLFPRFRLNVVQHFERLAAERPLTVERIVVSSSKSATALDAMLCSVIREVVDELHTLEERMGKTVSNTVVSGDDGDSFARMQPLYRRARHEHQKQPPRYVRKPWVGSSDHVVILFNNIQYGDATEVADRSMDDDLNCALRAHEPSWPFARLVESLLDLRRLRRAVRRLSPFATLFTLESLLQARTPRSLRDTTVTVAQPPDAPWTLSRHFSSIVALAIHRIGEVQEVQGENRGDNAGNAPVNEIIGKVAASDDDDDDDDVVFVASAPPPPQRLLVPRKEEVNPCMEYANRVVQSWCRDMRRRHIRGKSALSEAVNPVLMLVVFGQTALHRYTCRLTHSLADFQTLELNGFITAYQARHGADVRRRGELQPVEKLTSTNLRTWFLFPSNPDAENEDMEEVGMDNHDVDSEEVVTANTAPQEASFLFSQACSATAVAATTSNSNNNTRVNRNPSGGNSLHQLLLSQTPLVPPSEEEQPKPGEEEMHMKGNVLHVECISGSFVRLSARLCGEGPQPDLQPEVWVIDGFSVCASELIGICRGTPRGPAPHENYEDTVKASTTTSLRRILIVEQQLRFMRLLEMAQDALPLHFLEQLQVQVLVEESQTSPSFSSSPTTSAASPDLDHVVLEEREAFESLAHAKATLTGSLLSDHDTVRAVQERLESGVLKDGRRSRVPRAKFGASHASGSDGIPVADCTATAPLVVFDEREFRSLLPYALYCRGIDIMPMTLATADYVLSPEYALERKSVPDFIQSLFSGRIHTQLAALSRQYGHPICLIEFDRSMPFRLSFGSSSGVGGKGSLFARIARLFCAFPRVHVLWTRDAAQSASIICTMKRTCASTTVDPSTLSLTGPNSGTHDSAAAARETAHLAARVLSCFPGITTGNAPRVMALCGSLAGLATIDESALAAAIGETSAKQLYTFLHKDLVERVS